MTNMTQPLEDALDAIALVTNESESDPSLMLDMLNRIVDLADAGKRQYLAAVIAQQKADIAAMRA